MSKDDKLTKLKKALGMGEKELTLSRKESLLLDTHIYDLEQRIQELEAENHRLKQQKHQQDIIARREEGRFKKGQPGHPDNQMGM